MSPTADRLVGRQAELGRLDELIARPDTPLVLLLGEAGIGKSALLTVLATNARRRGQRIVHGASDELDDDEEGLWAAPLRSLGVAGSATVDRSIPPSERRWELVGLLAEALRDAAPALVLLDDVHWADDSSLWILDRLAGELSGHDVTLVAASRDLGSAGSVRWQAVRRRATTVPLGGLDAAGVAELIALLEADGPAGAPGRAVAPAELAERTGGNPLFIRELWHHRRTDRLPPALGNVLSPTIEALGPGTADVLATLVLAGVDCPIGVLAAALGRPAADVIGHLDDALDHDVLRRGTDGRLVFRHALLADAAVQRQPAGRRRGLHAALAAAWVDEPGPTAPLEAARHAVAAVPDVPAETAADRAQDAGQALLTASPARAAQLAASAAAMVELHRPGDVERLTRLRLLEADARWEAEDVDAALEVSAAAAELAVGAHDPVLRLAAEVCAVRRHNPLVPDPLRLRRLTERYDAAPDAPVPLRVRALGRRAVLAASVPDAAHEAPALGDAAVALARTTGDGPLLIDVLVDRHFAAATPTDITARDSAASEIITLAERAGRPDLAMVGQELQLATHARRGDLSAALRALGELELRANVLPSPRWRYACSVRRSALLALIGDADGAVALAAAAEGLGRSVASELEVYGLELGVRLSTQRLYGRVPDERCRQLHRFAAEAMGNVPSAFLQVHLALADTMIGELDAARRRLGPWLARPELALSGPLALTTMAGLAAVVAVLGDATHAAATRRVLAPFSGWMPADANPVIDLPVDAHLAHLALLEGDVAGAVTHAQQAVSFARAMPSPPLEARTLALLAEAQAAAGERRAAGAARDAAEAAAAPIGLLLAAPGWTADRGRGEPADGPHRGGAVVSVVSLVLAEGRWRIDAPEGTAEVADSLGMSQLVRLLLEPGTERAAVDLAGMAASSRAVPLAADLGPALDERAKRAYRRRINELRADIDEADAANDPERAAKHRLEYEALLQELRRAVGLGGRDRPQGAGAERARINTARTIRRAIAAIAAVLPDLGAHLSVSVHTGHHCSYGPEPAAALTWRVSERAAG